MQSGFVFVTVSGNGSEIHVQQARCRRSNVLSQRGRKFVGVFLILGSLLIHGTIFTTIYVNWLTALPQWALLIYFAIAGTVWFVPAGYIITWMSKPDNA